MHLRIEYILDLNIFKNLILVYVHLDDPIVTMENAGTRFELHNISKCLLLLITYQT